MGPDPTRVHGLDVLRSAAILGVMATHVIAYHHGAAFPGSLATAASFGWMGVDLFFVLSGYLIGSQFFRVVVKGQKPQVLRFYLQRFFRVMPAFFVVLAAYFLLPHNASSHMAPLWQYTTFTYNLFTDLAHYNGFSHVWSLCVEEHFYLFFPLIILWMMSKPSALKTVLVVSALLLFGIAIRGFFVFHTLLPLAQQHDLLNAAYYERISYPTYSHLDGLLLGVSLALLQAFRPALWQRIRCHGHALTVAGLSLFFFAAWLFHDRMNINDPLSWFGIILGYPLLAVAFALLTASALSENGLLSKIYIPGAALCSTLAYTLYLTHKAVITHTDQYFPQLAGISLTAWLAVFLIMNFALAGVLHLTVEKPFLNLRDRFLKTRHEGLMQSTNFAVEQVEL